MLISSMHYCCVTLLLRYDLHVFFHGAGQILQVNDDVVQISARYKRVVEDTASGDSKTEGKAAAKSALDEDLAGLGRLPL